jgi:hypothetical protein
MSLDDWVSLFIEPIEPMTPDQALTQTQEVAYEQTEKLILELFRQLPLDRALVLLDQLETLIDEAEAG